MQSENEKLKSSFVSQSLNEESEKKKIEINYQKQLEGYKTQLIFKVYISLLTRVGSRAEKRFKGTKGLW